MAVVGSPGLVLRQWLRTTLERPLEQCVAITNKNPFIFGGTMKQLAVNLALAIGAAVALVSAPAHSQQTCDRACLEGFVDVYLDALVHRDPSRLALTRDMRFTENTVQLNLGDGLWLGADGIGKFKVIAADPQWGTVGFFGVVTEHGIPRYFALRLGIKDRKIREIETVVGRVEKPTEDVMTHTADEMFAATVAAKQRRPRGEMVAITNSYFETIEQNNGNIAPFDKNCNRFENGVQTTNNPNLPWTGEGASPASLSCRDQFNSRRNPWLVPNRKFPVVDEERGVTMTVFNFSTGAKDMGAGAAPSTVLRHSIIAELFKIQDGRIQQIIAVLGGPLPYGSNTGW